MIVTLLYTMAMSTCPVAQVAYHPFFEAYPENKPIVSIDDLNDGCKTRFGENNQCARMVIVSLNGPTAVCAGPNDEIDAQTLLMFESLKRISNDPSVLQEMRLRYNSDGSPKTPPPTDSL